MAEKYLRKRRSIDSRAEDVQPKSTGSSFMKRHEQRAINKKEEKDAFHLDLWLTLALSNWILDFGRPIAALYVPVNWFPLSCLSIGDYFHLAYNVVVPLCIIKIQERCRSRLSNTITHVCVIVLVMGASIHLVGDSVQHRLMHLGYRSHLSVRDNPVIKHLKPHEMTDIFELLYKYDEIIGHVMWYIGFFCAFFIYFVNCFKKGTTSYSQGPVWYFLVFLNGVYHWYLVTEAQVFLVFCPTVVAMVMMSIYRGYNGYELNANGMYLLYSFVFTLTLIALWVTYLWNDPVLRRKYTGWVYVPEPWTVFTLNNNDMK